MMIQLDSKEFKPSPQMARLSQAYLMSLWDSSTGGFRFAPHQTATLMATSYAVLGLEFVKGLRHLTDSQRGSIISFLMSGVLSDGSFKDPKFNAEDTSKSHDISYFEEETTTFCQQALDALKAPPPPPRQWPASWKDADGMTDYLESLEWANPWLASNYVMFLLSQFCHDSERHDKPELIGLVDLALDWIDSHQSAETGLWEGEQELPLLNAMAATFHFTFYYGYRQRPLKYPERIIDSCLKLQKPHGLFSEVAIGQTCLDYDAVDLLAKSSLLTNYRAEDVQKAMQKAKEALSKLRSEDGGFANCKEEIRLSNKHSLPVRLLRKLGSHTPKPKYVRIQSEGDYMVCWKLLACKNSESNAFSTWFRLLALRLTDQAFWIDDSLVRNEFAFRRLPFLGYHSTSEPET